jgi:hypothetical protein
MNPDSAGRRRTMIGFLLVSCTLSACETRRQIIADHEDRLSAAGFIIKPANTSERQAMLTRLPADKFVMRQNGDSIHYVYADPLVCDCLYVGKQQAYNRYKANELAERLADEQQITAQTYSDANWSWGAWGPWSPNPGFGFAYGAWGW